MRQRDTVIPPSEQLYRTVEADWVDGNRVLAAAIDGQGSSCARSAHTAPELTLQAARSNRPAENGLVYTTPGQLPVGFIASSNNISYDVFAYDDPTLEDDSHCEIRWRREKDRPSVDHFEKIKGPRGRN